jgi:hypothetical protein
LQMAQIILIFSEIYIQEYLDGESQILIHKEDPGLIRVKIHSRHISSKQYILWIQFTESTISGKQFTATDARFVYKRLISDALMAKIAKAKIV